MAKTKMKIAFFGSPDFAKNLLEEVNRQHPVSLVVTVRDKPVGRDQTITPTPVKQWAIANKVPCDEKESTVQTIELVKRYNIDIAIVAAYGKLIPKKILEIPKFGFFNIHYSLLPKYRGASPAQFAIINGDCETGVSIFQLSENLDDGPIATQVKTKIDSNITAGQLIQKLTALSMQPILNLISFIKTNQKLPKLTAQVGAATYTRTLTKNDGFIPFETLKKVITQRALSYSDLPKLQQEILNSQLPSIPITQSPFILHNFIRGLNPYPVAWTILPNKKRLRIFKSKVIENAIRLKIVQLEGRKITEDSKFINQFIVQILSG